MWQGSAYFWFFAATLAAAKGWTNDAWRDFALFNGTIGMTVMIVAVLLTIYSLVLYLRTFSNVFVTAPSK